MKADKIIIRLISYLRVFRFWN